MMNAVIMGGGLRLKAIAGGLLLASMIATLSGCGGSSQSFRSSTRHSLVSLVVSPANPIVALGDDERFVAIGVFANGTRQDLTSTVTWGSAHPEIAPIDQSGKASAKKPGTTAITASSGSITASATLTVPQLAVISIAINAPSLSVPKGNTEQLSAIGTYVDGSTKDITSNVTWASSAPGIVAANAGGSITGAAAGTATITASSGVIRGAEQITVAQPSLVSLAISPSNPSVVKGGTQQLAVTGTFSDGSNQDVTKSVAWAVSPASIAAVSPTGLVSTLAAGSATITAVSGSSSASALLTVSAPTLVSLAITPPNPSITKGGTKQLTVTGTFSDGSTQNVTSNVAWTSSSASVTVSNGMVNAIANGTATVTATSGSVSAADTVTVSAPSLVSIVISPPNPSVVIGKTQQLTVTGTFSDGSTQDVTSSVGWTVPPTNVVAVSSAGLVSALSNGTATVVATSGTVSGSDTITVSQASLVSITISPASPTIAKGQTQQFAATGTYNDGSTQDMSSKVLWSSSPANLADLSNSGLLTAKGEGTATVVASSGSMSGTATVAISAAIPVSINVAPGNSFIVLGATQQLKALEVLSDGTTKSISTPVTWTSDNHAVAAIDAAGLATAQGIGTASITASADSLNGSATLNVEPMKVVEYFDHAGTPGIDETLRLSNPGFTGDKMCAAIYVFAADQQLSECCACKITKNGLRTLSLSTDLTSNPLTGQMLTNGTVQIVPTAPASDGTCDAASFTPAGKLSLWATHIETVAPGSLTITGGHAQTAPLSSTDLPYLQNQCQLIQTLGSGQGICTCGTGD
jgi:uncharacterized protein YjdB